MDSQTTKPCGIILICGYLGSGKTTFIQHILKEQNTYKVAVIQNEYSNEMGIEAPLMQMADGKIFDKFYELPNGCVCCSAKEDLHRAIEFLCESEKYKLDYILVETNGLADPSSTIKTFWVGEDMLKVEANLRVIYSVVGAHIFEKNLENEIFVRQLLFADLILLNQIDRVDKVKLEEIEKKIISYNPTAIIKKTEFCKISVDELFSVESFNSVSKNKENVLEKLHENTSKHGHDHVHADKDIEYFVLEYETPFDKSVLDQQMGHLLWEKPDNLNIIRCKALLDIKDSEFKHSLQGVDDIYDIKESEIKWEKEENRKSKFLFIGKNVNLDALKNHIAKALTS